MAPLAPYAEEHRDTHGAGDARPTALKVIQDQHLEGSMSGKVFLVTGGTSGIGLETVRALHVTGADIFFTGRDLRQGECVQRNLASDKYPGKLEFIRMSLDSLSSVRAADTEFLERSSGQLNVLICNAGE